MKKLMFFISFFLPRAVLFAMFAFSLLPLFWLVAALFLAAVMTVKSVGRRAENEKITPYKKDIYMLFYLMGDAYIMVAAFIVTYFQDPFQTWILLYIPSVALIGIYFALISVFKRRWGLTLQSPGLPKNHLVFRVKRAYGRHLITVVILLIIIALLIGVQMFLPVPSITYLYHH